MSGSLKGLPRPALNPEAQVLTHLSEAGELLTLEDVTMDFMWEEWQLLAPTQKNLPGRDVGELQEPGVSGASSQQTRLAELERGEEPWAIEEEVRSGTSPEKLKLVITYGDTCMAGDA
ncbi:zinc finger protein 350 isoform X1 [Prionailurus iriomotensis]